MDNANETIREGKKVVPDQIELADSVKDFQNFKELNEQGLLEVTSDISYNVRNVVENNQRLYHSIFENPKEDDGSYKVFYNIGWIVYDTYDRNTDIDTKDLNMMSVNGKNVKLLDLIKMGVRSHLKRTKFAKTLNDIRRKMYKDGSVLCKIVGDEIKTVNLLNMIVPAYADSIQDTGGIEQIALTWEQIQAMKDDFGDNWWYVEKVREKMIDEDRFIMYQWWTWFQGKDGKTHKGCIRYFDLEMLDAEDYEAPELWSPYIEIDRFITPKKVRRSSAKAREELGEYEERFPYVEGWMIKVDGRWLGLGVFERLQWIIMDYNEKANLKRKMDRFNLKGILFHKKGAKSNSLPQDQLDDLETGGVLEGDFDEELIRLAPNMAGNEGLQGMDKIFEFARLLTGVTSQGTGEDMPANMPATMGVINQQIAKTAFDSAIESQSTLLVDIFSDYYIKTILEDMTREEWVNVTGDQDDLKEFDDFLVRNYMYGNERDMGMVKYLESQGTVLSPTEIKGYEDRMKKDLASTEDKRWMQITDEMVKQVDYFVEFYVNSESFDKNVMIKNLMTMAADPQYPGSRKKLYMAVLDLMDMGGRRFEKSEEEMQEEIQRAMMMQQAEPGQMGQPSEGEPTMETANQFEKANRA